jgi:hypothetical protein
LLLLCIVSWNPDSWRWRRGFVVVSKGIMNISCCVAIIVIVRLFFLFGSTNFLFPPTNWNVLVFL